MRFFKIKLSFFFVLLLFSLSGGCEMKSYNAEDFFSGTQLQLAQAISNNNLEEVKILAKTTELNKPGKQDMTLLFFAAQDALKKGRSRLDIISSLVASGANPTQPVPGMESLTVMAARAEDDILIKALLDGGMSPDAKYKTTPIIFYAASQSSGSTLKTLVERGADINQCDSLEQNALIEALANMELDNVIWLLNQGANPMQKTINGWGFGNMLKNVISREEENAAAQDKLQTIRTLAIYKGMKWPPDNHN